MDEATAATAEAPRSLPSMDAATAAQPGPTQSANDGGFDWGDAGIATSALAAALLAAAGMAFMHRRRSRTVRRSGAAPVTG